MARPLRKANVRLLGVVRRRRAALLVSTALCATATMVVSLPAAAQPAPNAHPMGGVVVGGSASISHTPGQTTINQSSQRGAINWQSFNVGSRQAVQFNQPQTSSVTLNQVQGPNPSQIAGRINANGQVIIENQSGVVFYKGAQVNTAGLMVSAATSSNAAVQAFINGGKLALDQAANPNAAVVNQGHITIKQEGLAALVAPQVANSGVITARLGHVVLAGASRATLDMYGDKMLSIDVTGQVVQAPNGATALVTNSGLIVADGGSVQLTARAADGVVTNLVDAGGRIQANTVGSRTGTITLNGVGGSVMVVGQLDAIGTAPGTKGGSIGVNATGNVVVASSARINASGQAGGGLVAIGTTLKRAAGGPSVATTHTAANVIMQPGAVISANATHNGNGGRVTVLSTGTTTMNGLITATGGPQGGDGGFVELSGGNVTSATGLVDVSAPFGTLGSILLDPDYLDIVASGGNLDGSFTGSVTTGQDAGSTDSLSGSVLNSFVGNVLLQAKFTIDVQSSFSITAGSLTMEAGQSISVDSGVTVGAFGDIILATGGAGPGTPPLAVANPMISIVGNLASSGGSVSLLAGAGGAITVADSGLVQAASGKLVTLQGDSMAFNNGKVSAPGGTIEIAPATSGNAVAFSGTGAGTLTVPALQAGSIVASTLRVGAATIGGTQTTTAGSITFDKSVNLTGVASTLDLQTTGAVTDTASSILTVGTLTGNAAGGFSLNAVTNNNISTIGSFSAGPNFILNDVGGVTIAGPVVATNIQIDNDDNNLLSVTGSLGATGEINMFTQGTMAVATTGNLNSPLVTLSGARGIELNGNAVVGQAGGIVDLSATSGNIIEASTATINAGTLQSQSGVQGTADLRGTANAIDTIGSFAAGGDFLLTDTNGLTIGNALSAGGSIYLQTSDTITGITIGAAGSVAAGSSSLVSFQTDRFTNSGTVIGGTFELAPNTPGNTETLGVEAPGLSLASLTGIGPANVRIGAVTLPGGSSATTTAGSIVVAGAFGASNVMLELDSKGGIDGTGGALTANMLTGSAGGDANFSAGNAIATLGNFVVTNGGSFNLLNAGSIGVTGSVNAANATITAGTIGVSGSIVAPGSLDLTSSAGGIGLTGSALLNGGTVALSSHTGITEASTSTILATDLAASAAAGSVVLDSLTNAIGTVTGLSASGGGVTLVVDPTLVLIGTETGDNVFVEVAQNGGTVQIGSIATAATVSATAASNPTVTFVADNIKEVGTGNTITATDGSNGGTVEIAPFSSATAVFLGGTFGASGLVVDQTLLGDISTGTNGLLRIGDTTAGGTTAGNVTIAGTVNLGTVAATLELDAAGSITEPGSLSLAVTTLTGTAGGSVALLGTTNVVGTLAAFTAGGNFALVDSAALTIAGLVQSTAPGGSVFLEEAVGQGLNFVNGGSVIVSNGTIGLVADVLTAAASGVTIAAGPGGTIEFAPRSTTAVVSLADSNAFSAMSAGELRIGGYHDATNGGSNVVSAASIDIAGLFALTAVPKLELDSNGQVTESTGTLSVGTLVGTVTNGVTLGNSSNAVATLGSFTAGGTFELADAPTTNLTVNGPVSASGVAITGAGTTTIEAGITATAGTVFVSSGSISLDAGGVLSGATVDLNSSAGGITEVNGGSIVANTLLSSLNSAGNVDLGSANSVGTLANFIVSNGTFHLNNGGAPDLTVNGSVIAGSVTLDGVSHMLAVNGTILGTALGGLVSLNASGTASAIALNGNAVVAGPTVDLTGGSIALNGAASLGQAGALVDLSTSAGGVIEATTATIVAATLQSTSGVHGAATLLSTHNTIANLLNFAVSGGDLLLLDSSNLTIAGAVSAADIFTKIDVAGGTLEIGSNATGAMLGATGTISLVADNITEGSAPSTITAAGGTVAIAPFSAGRPISLGGASPASGTLVADATLLGDINTGMLRIGSYDDATNGNAGTVTAGNISFDGPVNLNGHAATLLLNSLGSIVETGAGSLQVGTLVGTAASGVFLTNTNTVATLAGFIVSGGTFELVDLGETSLSVTGPVSATGVLIGGAGTTTITSGVTATSGSVFVTSGSIDLGSGGLLTGGTVDIDSGVGGIAETGGGSIVAGTLLSSAGANGNVDLASANSVGTLDAFMVTGGTFHLNNSGTVGLVVNGSVIAGSVTLDGVGGTLAVNSTISGTTASTGMVSLIGTGTSSVIELNNGAVVNGSTIHLNAGRVAMFGAALLGQTGALLDVTTSGGGLTEPATATIIAGMLQSSGGIDGDVSLLGSNNAIAALGSLAVTLPGTFTLADTGNLGVNGTLTAAAITIDDTGTLTVTSNLIADGVVNLTAGNITIPGLVSDGGTGTTSLVATSGTIGETGTLIAGTLSGSSKGATSLTGSNPTANLVGTLGSFSAAGFILNDGAALAVTGPVNGGTSATILDSQALTVNGSLFSSNAISLTGSSIAINGSAYVSDGGTATSTTSLIATNGTINEIGTLIAGTLSGSSVGSTTLTGATPTANQVANLGSFSAGSGIPSGQPNFTLIDGESLTVIGPVYAFNDVIIGDTGSVTNNGLILSFSGGTTISATDSITNNGTIGPAFNDVFLSAGTDITNNGTVSTVLGNGTLSAGGNIANNGTLDFSSSVTLNAVGSINDASGGSITAHGLTPGAPTIWLIAQTGSINEASGGVISAPGPTADIQFAADNTSAGDITIGGAVIASGSGTGTIGLTAGHSITQSSGSIIADGPGGTLVPSISLVAQTGTIGQSAGALIAAIAQNGNVKLTANSPTAGNITVAGTIAAAGTAGLVGLTAGASINQNAGTIIAGGPGGTLAPSIALLAQTGTIGQAASGTILATNSAGVVALTSNALDIDTAGSIGATGTAGVVSLTAAGSINQTAGMIAAGSAGDVITAGTPHVTLLAQNGTIIQSAGASILANNNAGTIAVTAPQSSITASGNVIAAGATGGVVNLAAGTSITQPAGTILAGGPGTISGAGSAAPNLSLVANNGTIGQAAGALISAPNAAGVIGLHASGDIAFAGTIAAPATTGGVALFSGGTIAEAAATGILQAGTLIGAAANGATLVGTVGTGNLVANLGSFNTGTAGAGDFVLLSGESLTVIAPVIANRGSVAITATHFGILPPSSLTNNSIIWAATNESLLADTNLTNTGSVVAQTGSASLTASTGTLSNSALIEAGTSATLLAGTDITNTGSVIAQAGGASLTASAGTLTNGGLVQANTSATMFAATNMTNTGSVIAQTGNASLTASTGTLTNGGLVQASTGATMFAGTDLTNTGLVTAQIGGASLTASTGTLTNGGLVLANTNATMFAGTDLTNSGSVVAQTSNASLTASRGILSNGGLVQANTSATMSAATDLTNSGSVIAQTSSASLTASTGTLTNGGLVQARTSATMSAGTNLTNTGSVIAQTSSASLTAGSGTLTNSGLVLANTSATMFAGTNLTNTGSVIAQTSSASLTASTGALTNGGLVLANTSAIMVAGTNLTNTGSVIAQTSSASLTASTGTLTNGGLVLANTSATMVSGSNLTNTGSVVAQTGNASLTASTGTLFNSGLISAAAANAVAALTANAGPIVQSGNGASIIAGGSVVMNAAGGVTLNGLVRDDDAVILNSGGTIYQDGTLIAALLTGSAVGSADLTGIPIITNGVTSSTNQVNNLGNFTVASPSPNTPSSFTLYDGTNLLISGGVSAATIILQDGANTISLGQGGSFTTGGAVRPLGALTVNQLPPRGITTQGAYLYAGSVIQTGSSFTVSNLTNPATPESILSITLVPNQGGMLKFTSPGLVAPNTWLIVDVNSGQASGQINVKAFDFAFNPPPGQALFTGTVNGFSGNAAAGASFIQPQANSNFRIDGCPIHSVNCALLATEGLPPPNPLNEIYLGAPLNRENPEDLVLPVVSDERYELVPCNDPSASQACPENVKPQ